MTFDREHLRCIACEVTKLCTKFERNQSIRGGVIYAISTFDLMTLNAV